MDFDGRTGLNNIRVVATSGNGYATASNYDLVITTGTVDGVSVVGEVVGSFSIENRSALMPTTAARTLVVDAAGLADATAVKVGPTGAATAQTAGDIIGDTNDIQTRLPAALVSGRMDSSVGAMAANTVTAAAIATDAIDSDAIAASAVTEIQAGLATSAALATVQADTDDIQTRLPAALVGGRMSSDAVAISGSTAAADAVEANIANLDTTVSSRASAVQATAIQADTDDIQTRLPAALVGGRIDASVGAMAANTVTAAALAADAVAEIQAAILSDATPFAGANINATISSRASAVQATAIQADTDDIQTRLPSALIGGRMDSIAMEVSTTAGQSVADEVLDRDLAGGASGDTRGVRNALRTARNRLVITAGGALTVYEEDDTTPAWTGVATRTPAVNPITEVNPA